MPKRYSYDDVEDFAAARMAKSEIARVGEDAAVYTSVIATGWPALDAALGGGLPRGSIAEAFGPELAGKTRLAAALCAHVLRDGGTAAFLDFDGSFNPAAGSGLLYGRPESADQAFDMMEALALSNAVDLVVVDSAAGLVADHEADGADAARCMANMLRRLKQRLSGKRACALFTRDSADDEEFLDQTWAVGADWHSLGHHAATRIRLAGRGKDALCTTVKCKLARAPQAALVELARISHESRRS